MDKETLLKKRADIEKQFKTVTEEMHMLQGEHRIISGLISELEQKSDPSGVIEVIEDNREK